MPLPVRDGQPARSEDGSGCLQLDIQIQTHGLAVMSLFENHPDFIHCVLQIAENI